MSDSPIEIDDWPDCAIEGCPNKTCLVLNSPYCFPHTPGNKWVKHMKIDAGARHRPRRGGSNA